MSDELLERSNSEAQETPREILLANSYLDDVTKQIDEYVKSTDNILIRAEYAKQVQRGDLALAHKELDKAASHDVDVRKARARASIVEGDLAVAVAGAGGNNPHFRKDQARWLNAAIAAFSRSIELAPEASAYYIIGLCQADLKKPREAVWALLQSEKHGGAELSLKSRKEIGRLDPTGSIEASFTQVQAPATVQASTATQGSATTPTHPANGIASSAPVGQGGVAQRPIGPSGFQLQVAQKPHLGFIISGAIVACIFHNSILLLAGLALVGWGLFKGKPE